MRGELDSIRVAEGLRLGILTTTHILVMLQSSSCTPSEGVNLRCFIGSQHNRLICVDCGFIRRHNLLELELGKRRLVWANDFAQRCRA